MLNINSWSVSNASTVRVFGYNSIAYGLIVGDNVVDSVESIQCRWRRSGPYFMGDTDYDEIYLNGSVTGKTNNSRFKEPTGSYTNAICSDVEHPWEVSLDYIGLVPVDGYVHEYHTIFQYPESETRVYITCKARAEYRNNYVYFYLAYKGTYATQEDINYPLVPDSALSYTRRWRKSSLSISSDKDFSFRMTRQNLEWFNLTRSPNAMTIQRCENIAVQRAVEGAKAIDINSVDYLRDLYRVMDLFSAIREADFSTLSRSLSSIANLYLTEKYGWENLFRDTEELGIDIADMITTQAYSTTRGSHHETFKDSTGVVWNLESHCRIEYDPIDAGHRTCLSLGQELIKFMNKYTVFNAESLWDMVPYSFVIDWFLPIGSALHVQDLDNFAWTLPVKKVCLSHRLTGEGTPHSLGVLGFPSDWTGNTELSVYSRRISSKTPVLTYTLSDMPKGPFGHWTEGTALIIQRTL